MTDKGFGKSFWKREEEVALVTSKSKFSSETNGKENRKKPKKRKRAVIKNDEFSKFFMQQIEVRVPLGLQMYTSQRLISLRVLQALEGNLNVLAESPTGSGKTMALLSSSCAWLRKFMDERRDSREKCEIHGRMSNGRVKEESEGEEAEDADETVSDVKPQITLKSEDIFENEWVDDFVPHSSGSIPVKKEPVEPKQEPCELKKELVEVKKEPQCTCLPRTRIYYGTRTHKQIAQVVKEFSRLPYANIIKHTILASREQSCINPTARRQQDIAGYCKEVNSAHGIGCSFKTAMKPRFEKARALRDHLEMNGTVVFDIEQAVETLALSSPQLCPYFCTNRVLTQDADLIFCPFSYLVDPLIRHSSDVILKESIIILDEAHNIEDVCRASASFSFTEKELDDSLLSLNQRKMQCDVEMNKTDRECEISQPVDRITVLRQVRGYLLCIENLILEIIKWIRTVARHASEVRDVMKTYRACTLPSWMLLSSLTNVEQGIDLYNPPDTPKHKEISAAFASITRHNEPEMQYFDQFKPNATAIVCIEKWLYFQSFFGQEKYQPTYRLNMTIEPLIYNTMNTTFDGNLTQFHGRRKSAGPRNQRYQDDLNITQVKQEPNEWVDADDGNQYVDPSISAMGQEPIAAGCKTTINMWCMSPAITFTDAFHESRAVLLASGTLCPMDTLKTELGMEFKYEVEGGQVIPTENIFAAVLPVGPYGNRLLATYDNTNDPHSAFYSEVGAVIKHVCLNVPSGILCFVPSYRVLEQLKTRMEKESVMRQIEMKKRVLFEPRKSSLLSGVMDEYEDAISNPKKFGDDITGALMFAVFRGKVSEGIDFADDRARVVISVGIPFPNSADDQVKAKKAYNNMHSKQLGILNGDQWYTTQAYRALNQALGRCLRHKNDWGAMIMLDERLVRQADKTLGGPSSARLSKWIRDQLKSYNNFKSFNADFRDFILGKIAATSPPKSEEDQ
ncbi:unnamed protein product [Caenorhabditis sp. 36 PRJEB53466]|nr:unnamed protein product [Caenorhabditis sp. 36 PRJEB53466]